MSAAFTALWLEQLLFYKAMLVQTLMNYLYDVQVVVH